MANNTMRDVASPIPVWTRGENAIERITVEGLTATGVYRSALSIESWAAAPIKNVVIRNANVEFAGGGKASQAKQPVKGPGVDARPLPSWGVYARNVEQLTFEDVRLSLAREDFRPAVMTENVGRLNLENFKFTRVP